MDPFRLAVIRAAAYGFFILVLMGMLLLPGLSRLAAAV